MNRNEKFYFIDCVETDIDNKKYLCICVLQSKSNSKYKNLFYIYKIKDSSNLTKYSTLKLFDDITERITYAIKSKGKIGLDIN